VGGWGRGGVRSVFVPPLHKDKRRESVKSRFGFAL
jgi:hypothetical protein